MWKKFECPDLTQVSCEEACAQAPIHVFSPVERGWTRERAEAGWTRERAEAGQTRERAEAGCRRWNTTPEACQLSGCRAPNAGPWTWQGISGCQLNWGKPLVYIDFLTCASHFTYRVLVLIILTCLKIERSPYLTTKKKTEIQRGWKKAYHHTDSQCYKQESK